MFTYQRLLFFLLSVFVFTAQGIGQVLRKEHDYLWQGQEQLRRNHWLDALDAIPKQIPTADTAYFKSLVYLTQGYLVQARKSIRHHLKDANHHYAYESQIIRGLAWSTVYHQAFGYFMDAININPNRVEAHLEKVKVLSDQKDYFLGIDHANEAIRLFPEQLELYVYRGNLYVNEGLRKRAFKDFKKIIDADKTLSEFYMAQAHRGLAWSYLGMDEIVQAEIHLMESMVMEPDHPLSHGVLSEILYLKGDAKGAVEAYENILGTENRQNYYLMIGLAYEELAQKKKACGFFKECCQREIPLACKKVRELGCGE